MKISTLFLSILLIYLIIVAFMYFNQRKLLYLPSENNYLDDPIDFKYREKNLLGFVLTREAIGAKATMQKS